MYARLVAEDRRDDDANFWHDALRGQIFMGDEDFAARMQSLAEPAHSTQREVPRAQRTAPARRSTAKAKPPSWKQCLAACDGDRDAALLFGYREQGMTHLLHRAQEFSSKSSTWKRRLGVVSRGQGRCGLRR